MNVNPAEEEKDGELVISNENDPKSFEFDAFDTSSSNINKLDEFRQDIDNKTVNSQPNSQSQSIVKNELSYSDIKKHNNKTAGITWISAIIALLIAIIVYVYIDSGKLETHRFDLNMVEQWLQSNKTSLKQTNQRWDKIKYDIGRECERIKNFEVDRELNNLKVFVSLGLTGVGKSTFLNRLLGDTSKQANQGYFRVGTGILSKTEKISKAKTNFTVNNKTINLVVVDTPGVDDSESRDSEFAKDLTLYLRGCGGVNIFGIMFDLNTKFGQTFQHMLKQYENTLGREFWKHCVIIGTKSDTVDNDELPDIVEQLRYEIMRKMLLNPKEVELPAITVGKTQDSYIKAIQDFRGYIAKMGKYNCENIKSSIEYLKDQNRTHYSIHNQLSLNIDYLNEKRGLLRHRIESKEMAYDVIIDWLQFPLRCIWQLGMYIW